MSNLERVRKLGEAARECRARIARMQEEALRAGREMVTEDAVRAPEHMGQAALAAKMDEQERMIEALERWRAQAMEEARRKIARMKNKKRRAFARAYYLRGLPVRDACATAGVSVSMGYRWRRMEEEEKERGAE